MEHSGLTSWLSSSETGASSKSIVARLAGVGEQTGCYPLDADDFARCQHLLEAVPTLKPLFWQMKDVNAYWDALVTRWVEISKADDKTAVIKGILLPIQKADPNHVQISDGVSMQFGKATFKGETEEKPDPLYYRAAALVIQEGKVSTSFVQRHLAIGYNKASRLIDRMEAQGIVSSADNVGKREVASIEAIRNAINIENAMTKDADRAAIVETLKRAGDDLTATALKEAHEKQRRQSGAPKMKPDPDFDKAAGNSYRVTAAELRQFVERIERLEADKKDIADHIKEVKAEAKGRGYDVKVLTKVIELRKRDKNDIAEEEAVLEMYKEALGMV